jgi:hypothetical protein
VLKHTGGSLRILVHPELRAIVQPGDIGYLEALLRDFLERVKLDPDALFKHLSSLGIGPLTTVDKGTELEDQPLLWDLSSGLRY